MARPGYLLILCALLLLAGCNETPPQPAAEKVMFGAVSFRIHPTFTQFKDWNGDGKPDGIEAVVEFQDQFGDPTRATGKVRFELYTFESIYPDHRGYRVAMWSASLNDKEDQVSRWDPAARGYTFQLAFEKIDPKHTYVLTAQIDRGESRLFDQLVVEPPPKDNLHGDRHSQHAPTNAPGHSY
jgi:hypothetical protein